MPKLDLNWGPLHAEELSVLDKQTIIDSLHLLARRYPEGFDIEIPVYKSLSAVKFIETNFNVVVLIRDGDKKVIKDGSCLLAIYQNHRDMKTREEGRRI